jgi:hypothetical protein
MLAIGVQKLSNAVSPLKKNKVSNAAIQTGKTTPLFRVSEYVQRFRILIPSYKSSTVKFYKLHKYKVHEFIHIS